MLAAISRGLTIPSTFAIIPSSTLTAFRPTVLTKSGSNLAESNSFVIVLATPTPSAGPGGLPRTPKAAETISFILVVDLDKYSVSNVDIDLKTRTASGDCVSRV